MDPRLAKACQGKSASQGGYNVPDLKKMVGAGASSMKRDELLAILCERSSQQGRAKPKRSSQQGRAKPKYSTEALKALVAPVSTKVPKPGPKPVTRAPPQSGAINYTKMPFVGIVAVYNNGEITIHNTRRYSNAMDANKGLNELMKGLALSTNEDERFEDMQHGIEWFAGVKYLPRERYVIKYTSRTSDEPLDDEGLSDVDPYGVEYTSEAQARAGEPGVVASKKV